jgi:hypothetical protein
MSAFNCQDELTASTIAVALSLAIFVLVWAAERILVQIVKDLKSPGVLN